MPCQPLPGDFLLSSVNFQRNFEFMGHVSATKHINVGNNIIGCVHAHDQWTDGTGGYAELVGGGVGHNHVDVKITSQFNRGFWFVIEVFGHPRICKYLRKCCVYFHTCPHAHIITADTLRFTAESLWVEISINKFLLAQIAFVASLQLYIFFSLGAITP